MGQRSHRKNRFQKREPKEFQEEVIQIDRVTRVVKGGRKLRFRATVAIGNKKGKVGIGLGKSQEVTGAIKKAIARAKRSLIEVPMDGNTIPHDIKIKLKAAHILFLPAGPGTGIIAGGPIRKILELVGIKDILSKSFGTTNKVNISKATFEALNRLRVTPRMERNKKEAAKKQAEKKPAAPQHQGKRPAAPQHQAGKRPAQQNKQGQEAKPATKKPEAKKPEDNNKATT